MPTPTGRGSLWGVGDKITSTNRLNQIVVSYLPRLNPPLHLHICSAVFLMVQTRTRSSRSNRGHGNESEALMSFSESKNLCREAKSHWKWLVDALLCSRGKVKREEGKRVGGKVAKKTPLAFGMQKTNRRVTKQIGILLLPSPCRSRTKREGRTQT